MATAVPNPQLAQIAMCVADIPRTLRFYAEVFGFASSGGKSIWGKRLAQIQGLGDDAQCLIWWMLGRQDFVQLEIFNHTLPVQKPLNADWRPSDLGYVRWGLAVPDFDAMRGRLEAHGVQPIAPAVTHAGLRRIAFRDPDGVCVEVFEDGAGVPGGVRATHHPFAPSIIYVAVSVPDMARSKRFYFETLGLTEEPADTLHTPEMEALWGLPGAVREVAVGRAGETFFELVQYTNPAPRPKPPGYHLADQGFLNVAFAFRERPLLDDLLERVLAAGYTANTPVVPGPGFASTYINDDQGFSAEIFGCPPEFDPYLGFTPDPGFGPPRA